MKKISKLLFITMLAVASLSAEAASWKCRYFNPVKNQVWIGIGPSYFIARNNARAICLSHTQNPANCNYQGCWRRW